LAKVACNAKQAKIAQSIANSTRQSLIAKTLLAINYKIRGFLKI
jgi:hypothetical protein